MQMLAQAVLPGEGERPHPNSYAVPGLRGFAGEYPFTPEPTQGKVKDFYFRLSEILRGYLGERYGFDALECTSSELMTKLRRMPTPGLPEDRLLRFVSESDMVKYARAESSPDSCREALAFGYELLDKTWPPPPPPEAVPVSHASGPQRLP